MLRLRNISEPRAPLVVILCNVVIEIREKSVTAIITISFYQLLETELEPISNNIITQSELQMTIIATANFTELLNSIKVKLEFKFDKSSNLRGVTEKIFEVARL